GRCTQYWNFFFFLFILKLWQTFCPLDRGVQSCPGRSSCACLQTEKTEVYRSLSGCCIQTCRPLNGCNAANVKGGATQTVLVYPILI
ncbi:hypothetical protein ANANG_G00030420, partial [Anguilla anguilla]